VGDLYESTSKMQLAAIARQALIGGVFLARGFYSGENSNADQHDGAHHNPVSWHMHEVRGVSQSADHDSESGSVNSKGHYDLLTESMARE
jgi:hypothetical protein